MAKINIKDLIKELVKDSSIKNTELAKKFNVSEAAIRKRIRELEKRGMIANYTVNINPRLCNLVFAIIGFDVKPEYYSKVMRELKRNKEILMLYSSTGDHMFMAFCLFDTIKDLDNFINQLKRIKGITRICPAILIEPVK